METTNLEDYPDRIAKTFLDKTILITGGTGFVGKVFIEKLLRACPDVKKIYVLVRTKKDKQSKERMEEVFQGPLFDMLKKQRGEDLLKKVEPISADMEAIDLDLSSEDRKKLVDEVEMIFHSAATVRFDEGLKKAVLLNVRATKLMLELAKECKKLNIFAYVNTAYSQPREKVLYEKAYPPPFNPYHIIQMCEWLDEKILDSITDKILGDILNTYVFTKAIAEALVYDEIDNLPAIILRPSGIMPIRKKPIPGWTDNINGPLGLIVGTGKGVVCTFPGKSEVCCNFMPIDTVVNYILCAVFIYFQTNWMSVQRRIWKSYELLKFYCNNQWNFNNDEFLAETKKLNPMEKVTYQLDGDCFHHDYFVNLIHGLRRYVLNETDDTIPFAKRFNAIMWFLDRIFKVLFSAGSSYFLYNNVFKAKL